MNILFVTGSFAGNEKDTALGGMAYAVYKSALGMQRRGHNVRILAVSNRERRWRYREIEVISVKSVQGIDEKGAWGTLTDILQRECCLESNIQKLNKEIAIDIIQYTGWFGIGLFHSNNIPAVMRISSYTKVQLVNNYPKIKRCLLEIVEYLAAKRMNCIFAPSKIMAVGIEKDVKKKIGVIETPYMHEEIEWDDKILKYRLADKRYILFSGRMSADKGIYIIRDILYKILDENKDIYFVFAGKSVTCNGEAVEQKLRYAAKEYQDRVIFLGWLQKDKLIPIIKNADMILIPSLVDNLPNSCAEAMAYGKIVIGTDGSSLEQFITDKKNGFLVEPGNAKDLYICIKYVLEMDKSEREILSEKAIKTIEKFDLDHYSKKMERMYNRVIEKWSQNL